MTYLFNTFVRLLVVTLVIRFFVTGFTPELLGAYATEDVRIATSNISKSLTEIAGDPLEADKE